MRVGRDLDASLLNRDSDFRSAIGANRESRYYTAVASQDPIEPF
jgi:hypothetical protein